MGRILNYIDEISVKIGEKLKLDVLLSNADKVQHQSRRSTGWKEVWKRGDGVQNHQLNDRDGNLIISNFTASDAGTYRVLDPEGDILIPVTVKGPHAWNGSKQLKHWIGPAGLPVFFGVFFWWFCLLKKQKTDTPYRWRTCRALTMLRCSNLLLLRCLVNHSGTPLVGTHSSSERGKKGGNIILECELENNKIINLIRRSKSILECQNEKCENKTENVQGICKEGACDIIIKNLSFSDAGTYILRYSHTNDPTEKVQQNEVQTKKYQLHIQDEASVKIGEELKLDVLSNAHKVKHQNKPSTEWTEVWSRSGGVQSERLTDTDGILSINNFTASDAGTYRVLDSEGEILITVTVTERRTESKEGLDGTEQHTVEKWIASVCGILVLAVIVIVITVIIRRRRRRGYTEGQVQENPDPQNM
ncbi:hypothetical protein G5714_019094 [Onychostoma macrolepis]|uniref:Immunoglobulin domain-containing protein n=1 Tax=Onychostoma macrolepis TaxID=369639 RepID=A0A7J6C0V1_9TELE|nr:hypothetical protein G5714_019094 [Onychostoma macrolepis]